jgi:hypothetical protein
MSERHTSRKPLKVSEPGMRPEYDFSGAVRGKYYKRYLKGANRGPTAGSTAHARKRAAR